MQLEWTVPIGTLILIALQLGGITVAGVRLVATLQRAMDAKFSGIELALNTFKEGDLRELRASVLRLETGQDEWTKALRKRTHDLGDDVNVLKLKVDRLERPERYPRPADGKPS